MSRDSPLLIEVEYSWTYSPKELEGTIVGDFLVRTGRFYLKEEGQMNVQGKEERNKNLTLLFYEMFHDS